MERKKSKKVFTRKKVFVIMNIEIKRNGEKTKMKKTCNHWDCTHSQVDYKQIKGEEDARKIARFFGVCKKEA